VSTLSFLRLSLAKQERKLNYLTRSENPKSAWVKTSAKIANLRDALAREESRLYTDPAARL